MNEIIIKEPIIIEDMIYEIRGRQVMIDSDVAMLFGYETKNLNRQVQRNIKRFPENYCFRLTEEEYKNLRCQMSPQVPKILMEEEDIFHMYLQSMVLQC